MTSALDSCDNKLLHRNTIHLLNRIIDVLSKYKENYGKKLNFTKLIQQLRIPNSEIDDFLSIILNFQETFEKVFKDYRLKKERKNNQVYLTIERDYKIKPPNSIKISASHIKLLNDIIYTFKFVKRGKGFDINKNGTELLANLKKLKNKHPYLFESHGDGVIYPSELGLKFGDLIISYNKSNKVINNIQIENCTFIVEEDG